ncbi:LuxR C-terminal-related transcriptional regulator [Yersinia sp. 1652 StPb PI]|uniref:helix-turn-helix transcriptional regulator n=1 Tax=Yersinia sp. 1652 StPb PI TaxID=3061649 RepID=UPI00355C8A4B
MFNCVIDVKDNYFRHGLFILLSETLAEYHTEQGISNEVNNGQITFSGTPNTQTRLVFIDADNTYFCQAFEQTIRLNQRWSPSVFIILKSRHVRQPREMVLDEVVRILYKNDEATDIKQKIREALISWALTKKPATALPISGELGDGNDVRLVSLTRCERVVIYLFGEGFTGKSISQILSKSEKTISGQKRSAMRKLDVCSDVELFCKVHQGQGGLLH